MKILLLVLSVFAFSFCHAADTTTVSMQVGGVSKFATIKVADATNGVDVAATVSNIQIANNNPLIADVAINTNAANSIKVSPKAQGTGTATVTCNVSYTDPGDGLQKNESKTIVIAYTVVGTPHGVSLSLVFN